MLKGAPRTFATISWVLSASAVLVIAAMPRAGSIKAQASQGTVRLVPPISNVDSGDGTFSVYIVLDGLEHLGTITYDDNRDTVPDREVESVGMAAFEFTIEFDETVVAIESVEAGPTLEHSERPFQCLPPQEEPGLFRFGCLSFGASPPGLQGSLTLATVALRPLAPGSSPLLLQSGIAGPLGDSVSVAVTGGAVRVTGAPAATTPGSSETTTPLEPILTPEVVTVTTAAPPVAGQTVSPSATLTGDGGRNPTVLVVNPRDFEADNGPAASGGGSSGGAVLWIAVGLGALIALAAIGLAAVLLRRRTHLGGA